MGKTSETVNKKPYSLYKANQKKVHSRYLVFEAKNSTLIDKQVAYAPWKFTRGERG